MTKALLALAVTGLFALGVSAQTETQANGSASTNTSVQAGQTGASANTQSSTDVDAQTPSNQNSQHKRDSRNAKGEPTVAGGAGGQGSLAAGARIPATLNKSVDARKAKPGDEITAKTTQNARSESGVTIPRGSRLIGHVTQANARAKGDSDSVLGIAFDRAVLKNGQEIPLNASIQAIAAASGTANMNDVDDSMGAMGNAGANAGMPAPSQGPSGGILGGTAAGVGNTAGGVANGVGNTVGDVGGAAGGTVNGAVNGTVNGQLTSASTGVIGLRGLQLDSAASNATSGSVITSTGKDVKLDSGTQLLLQAH